MVRYVESWEYLGIVYCENKYFRDAKPSDFIVSLTILTPSLRLYDFNCIPYDNL